MPARELHRAPPCWAATFMRCINSRDTSLTIQVPLASAGSLRGRGGVEPGTYESARAASVYEAPASSSKIVTQISKGTQLTVVRSVGDWVEIRSKHGNPPGYIRVDDVAPISRSK